MSEETTPRPAAGRNPYPRRPLSVDGFSSRPPVRPRPLAAPTGQPQLHVPPVRRPVTFVNNQSVAPGVPTYPPPQRQVEPVTQPVAAAQPVFVAPQPAPQPVTPVIAPTPQPAVTTPEPAPIAPTASPKPKQKRRIGRRGLKIAVIAVVAIGALAAVGGYVAWQAKQNNPQTVFKHALTTALTTSSIQTTTTSGRTIVTTNLDYSNQTNWLSSSQATIQQAGSDFSVNAYGSFKNHYISYGALPSVIGAPLAKAASGAWIQTRSNGQAATAVTAQLAQLSSPSYQSFGPVVVGNFSQQLRTQLLKYMDDHTIYKYDPKQVTHTTLGNEKVLAYPVTFNVGYAKILHESAAARGVSADELQSSATHLDVFNGAALTVYVSASTHRIVEVSATKNGQTLETVAYQNYDSANVIDEPQTKLVWANFAQYQLQLEAQAAVAQPPAQRDADRQARLNQVHTALATYFTANSNYPSFTQMNDPAWVATNLGIDSELLHDPLGLTATLSAAPKVASFAYQPTNAAGKACDNSVASICVLYKMTAILSNNTPFVVQQS